MYSLFISTFDKTLIIGLLKDGKVIEEVKNNSNQNHSELVMPIIENIFESNKLDVKSLNEILVVNGPGSFTGVRLGVTIAKTLAYTLNINIKTITSLECISVSNKSNKNKLVTISDLKGKYVGYFDKNNNLLKDLCYLKNDLFEEYIKDKKEYLITNNEFDLENIYLYMKSKECLNPHFVNPIYIKNIEVLNDK